VSDLVAAGYARRGRGIARAARVAKRRVRAVKVVGWGVR